MWCKAKQSILVTTPKCVVQRIGTELNTIKHVPCCSPPQRDYSIPTQNNNSQKLTNHTKACIAIASLVPSQACTDSANTVWLH